jgi:hypothetical protein
MKGNCTLDDQADIYRAVLQACLAVSPHCDAFMVPPPPLCYTQLLHRCGLA